MERYKSVGTESWRLVKVSSSLSLSEGGPLMTWRAGGVVGVVVDALRATTLEQMLAFWIALRIEGENPPETSVPSPT